MNPVKLLLGFLPWLLYSVLTDLPIDGIAGPAAILATVVSVVLLLVNRKNGISIIDATSAVVFGALTVVAFAGGAEWIHDYGRATSAVVLAVVMLISSVTVPFSEQYARSSVPQQYWGSPIFRAKNRRISALWGFTMLIMTGSHLLATFLLEEGTTAGQFLLNWLVPALLVVLAVKQTKRMSGDHVEQASAGAATTGR
ncbi:hypothetical protein H4P1_00053 (plasmid) [Variovorax sp. PBS-H4]|uniref:hypothetical protein n=1 Tax=Variovorax sp. PBS-H4 TaxID=434008 RepID=UPI0013168E74|nr:hypothetical protein [Variovorax sp. PBS-H4]VTU41421.1 hypothetical protein H4P1_00053 [Variovorax sp. PBS-H4]